MLVLVQASVLSVGLGDKERVLQELPLRLISMESGIDAARSLKKEKIDGVISKWNLKDMVNGLFIKKLRMAKPEIPTIVFVRSGDKKQEIAARSIGASAVLPDDVSDELFRETVENICGIKGLISIKAVINAESKYKPYVKEKVTNLGEGK
jgi:DNA-binding NarL/FixJ family response regulator